MTDSILNIELHPAYFAYVAKMPNEKQFSKAHIEHLASPYTNEIDLKQLSTWLKQFQKVWNQTYSQINIAIHGNIPITTTPDIENGIETLKLLHHNISDKDIILQKNLTPQFVWTYSIPFELKKLLDSYFVNIQIVPPIFGMCKYYLSHTQISQLYLHITPQEIYFFYLKGKQPQYYNCFQYSNKEDILYYTLLVYKMLDIPTDSYPIALTGLIEKESEIYQLLYQYIQNIYIEDIHIELDKKAINQENLHINYLANLLFITH